MKVFQSAGSASSLLGLLAPDFPLRAPLSTTITSSSSTESSALSIANSLLLRVRCAMEGPSSMEALFLLLEFLLALEFLLRFDFDFLTGEASAAGFGFADDEDDDDEEDDELGDELEGFEALFFPAFDFSFSSLRASSTYFSAHGWNTSTNSAG